MFDQDVASNVDRQSRLRDVYAVDLTRGEEILITAKSAKGCVDVTLADPQSKSFEGDRFTRAFNFGACANDSAKFSPAVTGTYFIAVTPRDTAQMYGLKVTKTGTLLQPSQPGFSASNEIPGSPIALGQTASGIVDRDTRPREVFSINLVRGQNVLITAGSSKGCVDVSLVNPGSKTFEGDRVSKAKGFGACERDSTQFVSAVEGAYYLAVTARDTGQRYQINISAAAASSSPIAEPVPSDLPGKTITLGQTITSIVDRITKPRDAYTIQLNRGQEVLIAGMAPNGCLDLNLAYPGAKSFDGDRFTRAQSLGFCQRDVTKFAVAMSGLYAVSVSARDPGQQYSFSFAEPVSVLPDGQPGFAAATDIPGTTIGMGQDIVGLVDRTVRKRDAYSINLTAGQEVLFIGMAPRGCLDLTLATPSSTSFENNRFQQVMGFGFCGKDTKTFTPATSGVYQISVAARDGGQAYTLRLSL